MKKVSALAAVIVVAVLAAAPARAATYTRQFNYVRATALAAGTHTLTFNLYDAASGGKKVFSESKSIAMKTNLLQHLVGSVNKAGIAAVDLSTQLWIEVKKGTAVVVKREVFPVAPYALQSENAISAGDAEKLGGADPAVFLQSSVFSSGDFISCYSGDVAKLGVGQCKAGVRVWNGSGFGVCTGEVLQETEICDGVDNDCNGQADEIAGCCTSAAQCPGNVPPGCYDPSNCQGYGIQATCVSHTCGTIQTDDDSPCTVSYKARDCGLYLPRYCSGASVQASPQCSTSCGSDAGCVGSAFCDTNSSQCVPRAAVGIHCTRNGECLSGFCADDYCCYEACNGVCESCANPETLGSCTFFPMGTDPDNECPAANCNGSGACL